MGSVYLKPLHCGISVSNIQESIKWYRNMLDFELVSCKDMTELNSLVAFIRHGDFEIELFEHHNTIPLPIERVVPNSDIQIQGTKHICFQVDDIVLLFERLDKKGADIVMGPQSMENALMGFIHDNNGTLIEFIQKL